MDKWIEYYRTLFNIYQLTTSLKWAGSRGSTLTGGPTVQVYTFDKTENRGRFINNTSKIGSYDSMTIDKEKAHAGLSIIYTLDRRNNKIFPSWGCYLNVSVLGLEGLNRYSKGFIQVVPEATMYKTLNARSTIIFSNRLGGGITIGQSAFYQSLFLGGHENLYGFAEYRFAGQHMLYNNMELRIKLDVGSYILPGRFGLTTFFDIGRVWEKAEDSNKWHTGMGGGFYFSPAQLIVFQFVLGYSREGCYPYLDVKFRY